MTTPFTREKLAADLRDLGVEAGDILFTHSSFKSLGPVGGGAATVIAALEGAVGPDGLLLMPSFNLLQGGAAARAAAWHVESTPSTVGWLTEFFRRMPGTVRSDHYSHSVAARGRGAAEFTGEHLSLEGLESPWDFAPWGRTYGARSPMVKAYEAGGPFDHAQGRRTGGKILMLGVDYHSSTYQHLVEVLWWNERRRADPAQPYRFVNRDKLGAFWDGLGRLRRARVGQADSRLFPIRDYVDTLLAEVRRNPQMLA